ncbi:MAG TPA: hypothetical protein VKV15_21870 [Bryobacteraceae bacterium]|nr:hypothetical protein [Bryobacteraceae bacterium]
MKKILTQYEVCALAAALLATDGAGAAGRNAGRLRKSAGALSDKFTGLARIRSGKYDWKPGQGVRSVADVFNLIVMEHAVLVGVLSGTPDTGHGPRPSPIRRNCRKR